MDVWVSDMRDTDNRLQAPKRSAGFNTRPLGGYRDMAEECEGSARKRAVELINAVLDGFSPVERCAVYYMHGLAVFRFRQSAETIYLGARMKIGIRLRAADFALVSGFWWLEMPSLTSTGWGPQSACPQKPRSQ